jgi:hypothetical protein
MYVRFSGLLHTQNLLKKNVNMLFKVASCILYYKLLKDLMDNALERKQANYRII